MIRALGLVALLALGGCSLAGRIATAPHHATVGPPPDDLLAVEVAVPVPGGEPLAGWFVPAPDDAGGPAVLLLHGITDDRRHLVGRARMLREAGFATLLVDLPAHGASAGRRVSYGWTEREAVVAAVRFLRHACPGAPVGVVGISLGGAAAALAGDDLGADAVVLEMVFPTFEAATRNRLRHWLGAPGEALTPALLMQTRARLGVAADSIRPVRSVESLAVPTLIVGGSRDPFTPMGETLAMFEAAAEPRALWIVPDGGHEDLLRHDPDGYRRNVVSFLEKHLRPVAYERAVLVRLSREEGGGRVPPAQRSARGHPDGEVGDRKREVGG